MVLVWAISAMCAGSASNYQGACNKFLEASSKQVQLYQYDAQTENTYSLIAKQDADDYLGKGSEDATGSLYFLYKTYKNKSANFKLPDLGICNTMSGHLGINSYSLNLKWNLY